jgi:hypothetical protein
MARMEAVIFVLQQMEEFDEQIVSPRLLAEERLNLFQGWRIDLTALRLIAPAPPARTWMDTPYGGLRFLTHGLPLAALLAKGKLGPPPVETQPSGTQDFVGIFLPTNRGQAKHLFWKRLPASL